MTTVHDVLKMIRQTSKDNHERGTRFERLMGKSLCNQGKPYTSSSRTGPLSRISPPDLRPPTPATFSHQKPTPLPKP